MWEVFVGRVWKAFELHLWKYRKRETLHVQILAWCCYPTSRSPFWIFFLIFNHPRYISSSLYICVHKKRRTRFFIPKWYSILSYCYYICLRVVSFFFFFLIMCGGNLTVGIEDEIRFWNMILFVFLMCVKGWGMLRK